MEVMQVSASDGDVGENGEVRYHLRVGDANVQETQQFTINPITGELNTRVSLDREDIDKYEVFHELRSLI